MAGTVAEAFVTVRPDTDRFGGELKGKLGGLAGVATKAAAGIAVAIGAAAAKGIADFSGFQRQMNEVFTLLPGISGDAMETMEGQVKDFSKEFGVLPDEVVPALYQSLSAGVPQDNVFAFMETAQKAAKGGVTELTTAVDGISSVVNAYGDEAIDAKGASDLMFTAVRLGKTTFEEMSSSLSNVIPVAAASNVEFENITAAIATMTAQGVPTAQATTQIRQALVEMGDAGSAAGKAFEDVAGESFRDFMAAGGDMEGAIEIMTEAAERAGVPIDQMFGSVEAGSAILAISGSNLDEFQGNLDAMRSSAGATEDAFAQMETGIGPVWDKLKAAASVALLELGDRLAPIIETLGNLALSALPAISTAFETMWGFVKPVVDAVSGAVTGMSDGAVGGAASKISGLLGEGGPVAVALATFRDLFDKARQFIDDHMGQIKEIISGVLEFVTVVWDLFGDDVMQFVRSTFDAVMRIIGGAMDVVQGIIETVLGILTGDWSRAWDGIKQILEGIWGVIIGIIERAWATIQLVFGAAFDLLREAVGGGVENVIQFFRDLPGNLLSALGNVGQLLVDAGRSILQGLWNGLKEKWEAVKDWVGGLGSKIKNLKGPIEVDRKLLIPEGEAIMRSLGLGLDRAWGDVAAQLSNITDLIPQQLELDARVRGGDGAAAPAAASLPDPEQWGRRAADAWATRMQTLNRMA